MAEHLLHPSAHAARNPHKPAIVMAGSGATLTYGELDQISRELAQFFRSLGLSTGDGIVVLLPNGLDYFKVYWGAQRAGLFFTPISTQLQGTEIDYLLSDSDAKVVVTDRDHLGRLHKLPALKQVRHRFVVDSDDDGLFARLRFSTGALGSVTRAKATANDCEGADMLYSSGTTGRPKGVRNSRPGQPLGTVSDLFRRRLDWHRMDASTVYLSTAPLYHSAPLRYSTMTLRVGGTAIIMERFDAEAALKAIERYGVTHSQWVPTMFVRLLRLSESVRRSYNLTSHRFVIHAAAPCPIAVKEAMLAWWGNIIYEYYSGTEGNGQTVISPDEWLRHKGSVGRALHGKLHIVDAHGNDCPVGVSGRVYFEAGSRFEYYKDLHKTEAAYNDRGWSTLGDIGYLDAEGYLYLTDRESFMIISGGVNIYPQEVENALLEHPGVVDAAVFGIPNPDFGEEVKAAVQLAAGLEPSPALAEELIAHCRDRIAHLKCPRSVDFLKELPRQETGKLFKKKLKDAYWPSPASATPTTPA